MAIEFSATPAGPNEQTFTLRLGDAALEGERRGETPRALFLHGFGSDRHGWNEIWSRTDVGLPAIRYDLRGFGVSRLLVEQPFSHAEDLLALLDALEIERADLIGLSMGGSVALNFALSHPERMHRLVLISPNIVGWDWTQDWRDRWHLMKTAARAGDIGEARRLWASYRLFDSVRDTPAGVVLMDEIGRYSGNEWVKDWQRDALPDIHSLPFLGASTLLLTGGRDLEDFRLTADVIEGAAPDVTRIDYPEHGHMLTLEAPKACAAAILDFLQRS
jgi:2-succinyl-6-hydroxy-2,4-cyclohexadiene-1-carboxylate synthase